MDVKTFILKLSQIKSSDTVYNPYSDNIKAKNLEIYLNFMLDYSPKHLFVGEAPSYLGCRYTGIPFTDEIRLVRAGEDGNLPLLKSSYTVVSEKPHRECSASILWEVFNACKYFPLLWNIFPFHTHKAGEPNSNRTPKKSEVLGASGFVVDLISLFPSLTNIYALGRVSQRQLVELGKDISLPIEYIRHPANGGATICREKIREIAEHK